MRVHLVVVGRQKAGPERELTEGYLSRFERTGRAHGLGPVHLREVEDRKGGGREAEGALIARALPDGAQVCVLDERGQVETSPEFADRLAQWRDRGCGDLAFVIGGADGVDPALRDRSHHSLSFGPMVWPHMLARVMLAEQLYRAASILAGGPYHRS